MDQMLVEELESDITAARDKLRSIDDKVTTLNGRPPRQRISYNEEPEEAPLRNVGRDAFGLKDEASAWNTRKEIEAPGGVRKRISVGDRTDRRTGGRQSFDNQKRQRPDYLENEADEEEYGKRQKRTIQSTVVMPALDSKGREEKIEKLKETENKDSKQRNRRLFSNLIMGTLSSFKKTEKKTTQQEKQEEVEKKLEETKKKDFESRKEEKHDLLNKRREQEKELKSLQRKKALIQYAEHHANQLKLMKGWIKTTTSPHIFWQPVKHTVRSLELKQATERQLDDQIADREEQLKKDLEDRVRQISEERGDHKQDEDDEYEEEDEKNENEDIVVVLKTEDDVKAEDDEEKEDDIDVHVELD
ncbi:Pinin/SDK/MemA protein domain-containing protein [Caenorhabditis elegans]|uniref:Pinin/SDK/MemA protein domain-containing protein n=1 Tax=Caenorhabditis elegans TaxID=6239 RepID=Q95ZQ5_CAEEL|nr:Pinin/SDK/MemA protein domain-containing protein [Caenorhabditis elegans]CAC42335.1 Pinin/SDK/MemA protein domain-containing protein [Caenorhabditis elegans]|eukprot:NP_506247.1 PiNiN nuclear speckle-associated protein and splicing factor homolog [Caenorhabditis elegans]